MTRWILPYDPEVVRWLRKADPQVARRIRDGLTAVAATGQPRSRGKALTGPLAGLWRYLIGDWRVACGRAFTAAHANTPTPALDTTRQAARPAPAWR